MSDEPNKTIFVRGADGALYALSPEDLEPFKLPEEEAEDVTEILEEADKNPVAEPLSYNVVQAIQAVGVGVKISAVAPQVFTNTSPPPETSS